MTTAMQNSSRHATEVTQARRSSRAASRRASVISVLRSRAGSRRQSSPDQFKNLDFNDLNIDWNDPMWNSLLGNADGAGFDFQGLPGAGHDFDGLAPQTNSYNAQEFMIDSFDGVFNFDLDPHPETARASFNLLQNPLSALPGTPYYPAYPPVEGAFSPQLAQNAQCWQQGTSYSPPAMSGFMKADRKASKPRAETQVRAPLYNDEFAGYFDESQPYQYPDPIDPRLLGGNSEPYYTTALYQLEDEGIQGDDESYIPALEPSFSKRRSSQYQGARSERTRENTRKSTNGSASSRSTYPDRSRSRTISSKPLSQQMQKRKSVFGDQYTYETPKADPAKTWIRTNATTKGLTTRTAKCNHYVPSDYYTHTEHPLRKGWNTRKNHFKYTPDGEWAERTMSASQIRDYILHYPEVDNDGNKTKLMLYVQVGPTDSARRYLSPSWTKCRFRECPANVHQSGTILHGHYRVAFDDRSYQTNNRYDPHLAASAYVHLYCMERFLDLEWLCRKANVMVDTRYISTEPKTKFAASFLGRPEQNLIEQFIEAAHEHEGVRTLEEFQNYPAHDRSESRAGSGEPKEHEHTLTCRMHEHKANTRPPAQINQFQERGLKTTHLLVNKGDLEILFQGVVHKKKADANVKAKNKKRKIQEAAEEAEENDMEYRHKKRKMIAEAKQTYTAKPRRAQRHSPAWKTPSPVQEEEPWNVDDDDSGDDYDPRQPDTPGSRRSKRNANSRIDYREMDEIAEQPQRRGHSRDMPLGYGVASNYAPQDPCIGYEMARPLSHEQQPYQTAGLSPPRRLSSLSLSGLTPAYFDPQVGAFNFEGHLESQELGPSLGRRTSRASRLSGSTRSGSGIMREPGSRANSFGKRASFARQPVSQQQTFDSEAPADEVEADTPARQTRHGRNQSVLSVQGPGYNVTGKEAEGLSHIETTCRQR